MGAGPDEGTQKMATRQTTAARIVEIDFQVPALIADLGSASEAFSIADEARLAAQRTYDATKKNLDHEKQTITDALVGHLSAQAKPPTQAEIDRKLKSELHENTVFQGLEDKHYAAKLELDQANSTYEVARIHHRTLVAQINGAASALNFLSSHKTARAIALQNLADL